MPADLEHGIGLGVGGYRRASLRRDFVAHHIGSDELADHCAARTGRGRMHHAHPIAQTRRKRRQPFAHGVFRIAARAQILRIKQLAFHINKHQIRARGTHVYAQHARRTAIAAYRPWLRLGDEAGARHVSLVGKRCKPRQRLGFGAARKRIHQHIEPAFLRCAHGLRRMGGSTRRLHEHAVFAGDKLALGQLEHLAHRAHHALVEHHATRKQHRCLNRHFAHNGGLVAFHHGIAQPQQNILDGHAFLLAVDDVGFSEHGAAPRKPRHAVRARNHVGVVFDGKAQAPHLVFEKRARTRRAALIHRELQCLTVGEAAHEERVLRAHLHDASRSRGHHRRPQRHSRHVFEHAHIWSDVLNSARARARNGNARARAALKF